MSTDTMPTPQQLRARADAMAKDAKALRRDLLDQHETRLGEIGIARDRAARQQYGAEQSAASADIQVKREQGKVEELRKDAAELDAEAQAAAKRGDARAAEEARELADDYRNSAEIHAARARQAQLDAAALREEAAQHAREVVQLETDKDDFVKAGSEAADQIDKIEDQVRLLEEAATKLTKAEMLTDAEPPANMAGVDARVGEIATLQVDAERALQQVDQMDVDRTKITAVLPDARFESDDLPAPDSTDLLDPSAASGTGIDSGTKIDTDTGLSDMGLDTDAGLDGSTGLDGDAGLDTDTDLVADSGTHIDSGTGLDDFLEPGSAFDPVQQPDPVDQPDLSEVAVTDSGFGDAADPLASVGVDTSDDFGQIDGSDDFLDA